MTNQNPKPQSTIMLGTKIIGWFAVWLGLLMVLAIVTAFLIIALDTPKPVAMVIVLGIAGLCMENSLTKMAIGTAQLPSHKIDCVGKFLVLAMNYVMAGALVTRTLCEQVFGELTETGKLLGIGVVTVLVAQLVSLAPKFLERME